MYIPLHLYVNKKVTGFFYTICLIHSILSTRYEILLQVYKQFRRVCRLVHTRGLNTDKDKFSILYVLVFNRYKVITK